MSFADLLRECRSSPAAVIHEFRMNLAPKNSPRRLHAFIEGHDDESFYGHHIRSKYESQDLRTYRCGNKAGVYGAYQQAIKIKTGDSNACMFFVDKDLSDILEEDHPNDDRIFVTDTYSIENYLASRSVFERLWKELVRVNRASYDSTKIAAQFETSRDAFRRKMLPVMTWVAALRRHGIAANLNNINLREFFDLDDALLPLPKRRGADRTGRLETVTGAQTPTLSILEWIVLARTLRKRGWPCVIRGKFEAWFVVEYFRRSVDSAHRVAQEVGGSVQVKTTVGLANFVEVASSRCDCPAALVAFFQSHRNRQDSTSP